MLVWSGRGCGRSDCCFDEMICVVVVFHFYILEFAREEASLSCLGCE